MSPECHHHESEVTLHRVPTTNWRKGWSQFEHMPALKKKKISVCPKKDPHRHRFKKRKTSAIESFANLILSSLKF